MVDNLWLSTYIFKFEQPNKVYCSTELYQYNYYSPID